MDVVAYDTEPPTWWVSLDTDEGDEPVERLEAMLEDGDATPGDIAEQLLAAEEAEVAQEAFERAVDLYEEEITPRSEADRVNLDYITAYAGEQGWDELAGSAADLKAQYPNLKTFQKGTLAGYGLGAAGGVAAHTVLDGITPDPLAEFAADLGGLAVQYVPVIGEPVQHTIHQYPEVYAGVLAGQALGYLYGAKQVYDRRQAVAERAADTYPDAVAELDARRDALEG